MVGVSESMVANSRVNREVHVSMSPVHASMHDCGCVLGREP